MNTKTLKLGERSWEIPQLPFAVTIEIEPYIMAAAATRRTSTRGMLQIVAAGLKCVDPNITFEDLISNFIPIGEAKAAMDIICIQCGLEVGPEGEA